MQSPIGRRARAQFGVGWILSWPLTLVFGAMVFLSTRELNRGAVESNAVIGGPGWEADLPRRIDAVTEGLRQAQLPLPAPSEEQRGAGALRWTHRSYAVAVRPEEHGAVEAAVNALHQLDPGLTVSSVVAAGGVELRIGLDGLLTHTLRLQWQVATPTPAISPQLAMLVASLGDDLLVVRELVGLDAPVGIAVRPFRPFSKEVAELAHHFQREVWLDVSIVEGEDTTADADAPDAPGENYLDSALASVPYVVGVTGAAAGRWSDATLAAEIQRRKLLYLGPKPIMGTPPPPRAPELVSLTPENPDQLAALGAQAQDHGPVIAVSNEVVPPGALREIVPTWRAAGVDVVPVSSLLRAPALPAR